MTITIYKLCKKCQKINLPDFSESGLAGFYCYSCRKGIVPNYIPLQQHGKYLDLYFKNEPY